MPNDRVIHLSETTDTRLDAYRDLHGRTGREGERFIAESRLVVERLIDSGLPIESVLVQEGLEEEFAGRLSGAVPVFSLPKRAMESLLGFEFHRGVLACATRSAFKSIDDLAMKPNEISLALFRVVDQENLGSLLRTAAAMGIHRILLCPKTIDPFRRRVIRVSMASVLTHHFYRLNDPLADWRALSQQKGYRTISATLCGSVVDLEKFQTDDRPMIVMVGNEADGIDAELQDASTDRVRIPMQSGTDSLNVAVAAAIMMYQLSMPRK